MPTIDYKADRAYLEQDAHMSLHDYYYNIAFYYALGKGSDIPDGFAKWYVGIIADRTARNDYTWSVVTEYDAWKEAQ